MTDEAAKFIQGILERVIRRPSGASPAYQIFTRKFDSVENAEHFARGAGRDGPAAQAALDERWAVFTETLGGWKMRVAAAALDSAERVRTVIPTDERNATVVSLLVDLSGSMKGEKIMLATAAVDSAQDYLGGLGIRTEILGFTTRAWRGGQSRRLWHLTGMPANPGRLNDLLHIVFKSADDIRRSTDDWALRQMLRPSLLKENIDGEAIEWAVGRLRDIDCARRILIVLSDGASVDDSTLQANSATYLSDHLQTVIGAVIATGDIDIAALGIGYDVSRFYAHCAQIDTPSDIGQGLIKLLEQMIARDKASMAEQ